VRATGIVESEVAGQLLLGVGDDRSCPDSIDRLYTALVAGVDGVEVPLMIKTIRDENINQYLKATFCL